MSKACPIETSQEWIDFVELIGNETDARTAYDLFQSDTELYPSLEKAKELLSSLKVEETDEQLSRKNDSFKLDKQKKEYEYLQQVLRIARGAQKETIMKYIDMNISYQKFLEENIKRINEGDPKINTVSVSNWLGSSEFTGDPAKYASFQLLGICYHEILEKVQKKSIENGNSIRDNMTLEFFKESYDEFMKNTPFIIEDLSEEIMYNTLIEMINRTSFNTTDIILPEITVIGETDSGTKIIGRIDLTVIDISGNARVFDFKTKKLNAMITKYSETYADNADRAFVELSNSYNPVKEKKGTHDGFVGERRSSYDTWTLQLKTYENILKQNGINIKGQSTIIAYLYQVSKDGKFQDGLVHAFDAENFYEYTRNSNIEDGYGKWINDPVASGERIKRFHDQVNSYLPTDDSVQESIMKEVVVLDFNPNEKINELIIKKLQDSVNLELTSVNRQIVILKKENKNDSLLKTLEARKITLSTFKEILDRKEKGAVDEKTYAINFSSVMGTLESELSTLLEESEKSTEQYLLKSLDKNKEVEVINNAFAKTRGMTEILNILKNAVNDAILTPDNKMDKDSSTTMKKLGLFEHYIQSIEANFRQVNLEVMLNLIKKGTSQSGFNRVATDLREVKEMEIKTLERELQALKDGSVDGLSTGVSLFLKKVKKNTISFLSTEYKKRLAEEYGEGVQGRIEKIETLERKIKELRDFIDKDFVYGDDEIKNYILGVTVPGVNWYLGSQTAFSPPSIISGLMLDQGIASASNKDFFIASLVNLYKNTEMEARRSILSNEFMLEIDHLLKQFRDKNMSIETLNSLISEKRPVTYLNQKTNQNEVRNVLSVAKHFSLEYEQTWKNFDKHLKELYKKEDEAKTEYNLHFGKPDEEEYKQKLIDAILEKEKFSNDKIEWMRQNCSLPYKTYFYDIHRALPYKIREQIQQKRLQIDAIISLVGKGNEADLPPEDFDEIFRLEDDIRMLRYEARKENLTYADDLGKEREMYNYELVSNFEQIKNNAILKYSENPKEWAKWKRFNLVTKPNSDWYEDRNALYEERALYFDGNPILDDLYKQRLEILKPHKDNSRIQPQFLSESEIRELDRIEAEIEEYMEETSNEFQERSPDEQRELRALTQKINSITTKSISKLYTEEFNDRYNLLKTALSRLKKVESRLNEAISNDNQKNIDLYSKEYELEENNFLKEETEFEKWFNLNHRGSYESILLGVDVEIDKVPKSFNYENLPPKEMYGKYMEEDVPHPKYFLRRLKEDVKNDNFLESPDGIPMPNNIAKNIDGSYSVIPGMEHKKFEFKNEEGQTQLVNLVNPKYLEISKDKNLLTFYNKLLGFYFKMQEKIDGKRTGYNAPGFAASFVENLYNEGVISAIKKQGVKRIDKMFLHSEQDRAENKYGDLGTSLRLHNADQLPENMQSQDVVGSILKYGLEAQYNISMQEVAPQMEGAIEYLELLSNDIGEKIQAKTGDTEELTKRFKELNNIINIAKYEKQKFLQGQFDNVTSNRNRKFNKIMNTIFAQTAFLRIGFDVANQTKNYFSGNLQAFMAAGGETSDFYSRKDFFKAKTFVYGDFLPNYFRDYGKITDVHDSTLLYRLFDPGQKDFQKWMKQITYSGGKKVIGKIVNPMDFAYLLQDKGDTEIAVTIMYSVMNHNKYKLIDNKGKNVLNDKGEEILVPAHEAYVREGGVLVRRKDVNYTQEDENRIRSIIYSEMRRAQGNYAKNDMSIAQSTLQGKMIFFFKKYLLPQFLNRFGYLRPNWEAEEVALGYWRAVYMTVKHNKRGVGMRYLLLGGIAGKKTKDQVGKFMTKKVNQARRDVMLMAMMSVLAFLAYGFVMRKHDDDEELNMLEANIIRVIWGVKQETISLTPIGSGTDEYVRNFTSISSYAREAEKLIRAFDHIYNYVQVMIMNNGEEPDNESSTFYKQAYKNAFYSQKYGYYKKGDSKIKKDLIDLTGIRNFRNFINPEPTIDQLKRFQ